MRRLIVTISAILFSITAANACLGVLDSSDNPLMPEFLDLAEYLVDLRENGDDIYDIDSTNYSEIYAMAQWCPPSPAVFIARAIVEILSGEHVGECTTTTRSMPISGGGIDKDKASLGDNYPDPFTSYTIIPYYIPYGENGELMVTDILGRVIYKKNLKEGINELRINTTEWNKGVYLYVLFSNEQTVDSGKMILIR